MLDPPEFGDRRFPAALSCYTGCRAAGASAQPGLVPVHKNAAARCQTCVPADAWFDLEAYAQLNVLVAEEERFVQDCLYPEDVELWQGVCAFRSTAL